jgi:hypothetical protein
MVSPSLTHFLERNIVVLQKNIILKNVWVSFIMLTCINTCPIDIDCKHNFMGVAWVMDSIWIL